MLVAEDDKFLSIIELMILKSTQICFPALAHRALLIAVIECSTDAFASLAYHITYSLVGRVSGKTGYPIKIFKSRRFIVEKYCRQSRWNNPRNFIEIA